MVDNFTVLEGVLSDLETAIDRDLENTRKKVHYLISGGLVGTSGLIFRVSHKCLPKRSKLSPITDLVESSASTLENHLSTTSQ